MEQLKPGGILVLTLDHLNGTQTVTGLHRFENSSISRNGLISKVFMPPLKELNAQKQNL